MDPKHSIDIVIPIHNEALNLISLLEVLNLTLNNTFIINVIFVDDGSTDETTKVISDIISSRTDIAIKYIKLARNFGKEIAVKCGVDNSESEYCVIMDGDLQHPTIKIIEAFEIIKTHNTNIVHISKIDKDNSLISKIYRNTFLLLINKLSEHKIYLTDFMLMDRKATQFFSSYNESDFYTRGIISLVGLKRKEIYYTPEKRIHGETKFSFAQLIKLSIDAVISVSTKPLRLSIYFGLTISIISLFYGAYILFEKLFIGQPIPGFTTLSLGLFLLGGIQLLFLGIIGEYVGRTFIQSKNRPMYLIDYKESNKV